MITTYYLVTYRSHSRAAEPQWSLVKQTITKDGVTNEVVENGLSLADVSAMLIGIQEEDKRA